MSQLLLHGPIQVFKVASANHTVFRSIFRLDGNLQVDVKVKLVLMLQIGERLRILRVVVDDKGHQGFDWHHPRRDGSAKVFGQKGSKWNILPLLDVPG